MPYTSISNARKFASGHAFLAAAQMWRVYNRYRRRALNPSYPCVSAIAAVYALKMSGEHLLITSTRNPRREVYPPFETGEEILYFRRADSIVFGIHPARKCRAWPPDAQQYLRSYPNTDRTRFGHLGHKHQASKLRASNSEVNGNSGARACAPLFSGPILL